MIKSFRHKGLKAFFETGNKRGISPGLATRISRRLDVLNVALRPGDIDVHGFELHRLKGERKEEWSISVSGNWRITFSFANGDIFDVNLEDYH
jgi:proteic killer suppression protein